MNFVITETGESSETLQNLISDGFDPAESIYVLEHVKKKSQFDNRSLYLTSADMEPPMF